MYLCILYGRCVVLLDFMFMDFIRIVLKKSLLNTITTTLLERHAIYLFVDAFLSTPPDMRWNIRK